MSHYRGGRRLVPRDPPAVGQLLVIAMRHADMSGGANAERRTNPASRFAGGRRGDVSREVQEHGGTIDALRMALDEPLGDRKHGADRVHDLIVQRAPRRSAVLIADEPRAQTGPAFEQLGAPARPLLLDVGAA